MGIGINNEEASSIDTSGIPEFFTTHVIIEDAGGGMIRIIGCVARNGHSIPIYSSIRSAASFLMTEAELIAFAKRIVMENVGAQAAH